MYITYKHYYKYFCEAFFNKEQCKNYFLNYFFSIQNRDYTRERLYMDILYIIKYILI